MAFQASHRFVDIAPRKVRRVVDLIRRLSVTEALERLRFVPNRGARVVEKILKSAAANAQDREDHRIENLVVSEAFVNEGPRMKRIRPRARGMAFGILKRICHVHVAVDAQ